MIKTETRAFSPPNTNIHALRGLQITVKISNQQGDHEEGQL